MLMTYSPTKMKRIEFFTDPRTGEAMFHVVGETTARQLTETDREVIEELLRISETSMPHSAKSMQPALAILDTMISCEPVA